MSSVRSWGSLHTRGFRWPALRRATALVAPGAQAAKGLKACPPARRRVACRQPCGGGVPIGERRRGRRRYSSPTGDRLPAGLAGLPFLP